MLTRFLEVVAGDTLSFKIVLKDGVSPVDVGQVNFVGGIKAVGSASILIPFNYEVVNRKNGEVRVFLTPEQTRKLQPSTTVYEWVVRIENTNYAKTLTSGGLKVTRI